MAICQIMIGMFKKIDGYDNRYFINNEGISEPYYSDDDLIDGIEYCNWLLEENLIQCPINHYDLQEFILWAKEQIIFGVFNN